MALVDTTRPLARRREAAGLAMLVSVSSASPKVRRRTLCTGLTIQLIRGSVRMALCCGSTRMTSKYLYVESWLTQYELSTRRFGHRRPTRSSAVARRARWYLSWFTPWLVGLPAAVSASFHPLAGRTVGGALGHRPLAAAAAHAHAVDDVALLGLVAEAARLVRAGRARGAVDDVELAVLAEMHSQQGSTSGISEDHHRAAGPAPPDVDR
jgi:hypothetical protein